MPPAPQHFPFDRTRRLHGRRAFAAVYAARIKKHLGPITLFGIPNDTGHGRLGLSVPRRVGNAVARNRIKRLLREAFRLGQHEWPGGYDVIVVVRPHAAAALGEYRDMLLRGVGSLHREWQRQKRRSQAPGDAGPPGSAVT